MKQIILNFAIVFLCLLSSGFAQSTNTQADNILGTYWSPKKDAKIEIYKKGELYYGKFIWLESPKKDVKNPEASLKTRDVLGIVFLTNFSYYEGIYTGGKIYDPQNGNTYNCKMSLSDDNLIVRGFIGISLFGRTETFKRIKTIAHS